MEVQLLILIKNIFLITLEGCLAYKLLLVYNTASRNVSLKKTWALLATLILHDFCWFGLVGYKASYRLWISDIPQPTYLFLARLILFFWPLILVLRVNVYERLLDTRWQAQKRHYLFASLALFLMGYLGYCFFIRSPLSTDPWQTLDPFMSLLTRGFLMVLDSTMLFYGIKKLLTDTQMPHIVRKQAKLVFGLMFFPGILMQPLWILQKYNVFSSNDLVFELTLSILGILFYSVFCYAFFALFRLRLFNACPAVHEFWPKQLVRPLREITNQVRQATTLQELGVLTKSFFKDAFAMEATSVTLYIRPTNHERNVEATKAARTLPSVEALLATQRVVLPLAEKIKQKRFVLRAEAEYDDLYNLDPEAKDFRLFMEQINAELFLPVYGKKALVGYIVVERTAQASKLISDFEVDTMLTYTNHISHVIEQMQQMDPEILEKESLTYKQQTIQLFQEREHCYEGMRTLMQTRTSEAVGMVFLKQRRLISASTDGSKLLGLPADKHVVEGCYEQPLKQLIHDFKRFKREHSILLKDPHGNPLRFSVMRDSKQTNAVIIVSRPTVSTLFNFPSFSAMRDCADWGYAIFLQTTASGKLVEKFIPATWGTLFDFKITFLKAVLSRRPVLLQGADEDVQRLAELFHHMCAHTTFQEISLEQPEEGREIAAQLFGCPALGLREGNRGYLATVSLSGTLFIEHVERLSLETQELLAQFFATGLYTSFHSKQRMTSDALILCSSHADLATLVEQGLFSAALYEQLSKNKVEMPLLATLPKEQVHDLVHAISGQIAGESLEARELHFSPEAIDVIIHEQLPNSLCELRQLVHDRLESKRHKQGLADVVSFDVGFDDLNSIIAEARRQGRAVLKNKKLFCALFALLKSYTRVAEILHVDRTTVFRTCKKYQIDTSDLVMERNSCHTKTNASDD